MSSASPGRARLAPPEPAFVGLFLVLSSAWLYGAFGLRLSGVSPRDAGRLPFLDLTLLLCEALWKDLWLVSAALMLAVVAGAFVRSRWLRVVLLGAVVVATVTVSVIRFFDAGIYYYAGMHLGESFLLHARGQALDLRPGPELQRLAVRTAIPTVLVSVLLVRAAKPAKDAAVRLGFVVFAGAFLSAAMTLGATAMEQKYFARNQRPLWLGVRQRSESALSFPEVGFSEALLKHWLGPPEPVVERLDPAIARKLQRFGYSLEEGRKYPFRKDGAGEPPFPYPRRPGAPEHPNVILVLFESLSRDLTSIYGDAVFPTVTPNLRDFARASTVVTPFYNSGFPTLFGVMGTLCSDSMTPFPTQDPRLEMTGGEFVRHCLPAVLEEAGYGTTFVFHTDAHYVRTGHALASAGFAQILDQANIGAVLQEPPRAWGFSDHQTFRYLVDRLEQRTWEEPFFVTLSTIDTHAPFNFATDRIPFPGGPNPLLDAVYTSDDAFGQFWRYFKASPYRDNTIVIALADHSMYPGVEFQQLLPSDVAGRVFDRIPLVIYDPVHELPKEVEVVSSQLDVAPTVLHLLGVDRPHHFEGLSLFGRRRDFPQTLGIGGFGPRYYFTNQLVDGRRVLDTFTDRELGRACDTAGAETRPDVLSRCELVRFSQWQRTLHEENRIWP